MTPEQLKVILSAEDRTAAIFGSVARNVDKMGFNFDTLKAQAIGALGALSVPVSAAGLLTMVNSARDAVDKLKDLEDATGASVEKLSALDSIARATGSNIDTVGAALVKFNAVLKDADPDKGAGAVLKALNLDIDQLKKADPADAIRQVAIALQGFADDGDKARAVQELFGKSVKEVAPFLKDLAEAKRLDAKLTADQIEQVDRFNKEWSRLKATTEDLGRAISVDLISAINKLSELPQTVAIGKLAEDVTRLNKELKLLESIKANAVFQPADIDQRIADTQREFNQAKRVFRSAAGMDQSAAETARLQRATTVPNLQLPPDPPKKERSPGGGAKKVDDPDAAYKRYRDNLQKGIEAAQQMTAVEKTLRDIQLGRIGVVSEAQRTELLNLARLTDQMEAGKEATRKQEEADRQSAAAKKELQDAGQRLFEATRTDQEKLLANLAEIDRLQQAGAISAETAGRAAAQAYAEAAQKVQELTEEQRQAQRLANDFGSAFGTAATDVIFNSVKASDAVRSLGIEIAKIVIQQQVIKPAADGFGKLLAGMFGAAAGGGSGGVDSFNVWETYDGGGYTGSGARSGGVDGKGGFPALLHPDETVIDHSKGQRMGGSVNVTYQIDARNADAGLAERLPMILQQHAAQTKSSLLAEINRGGSAARTVGRA